MTDWATFVGITVVVLGLLLVLARTSADLITESDADHTGEVGERSTEPGPDRPGADSTHTETSDEFVVYQGSEAEPTPTPDGLRPEHGGESEQATPAERTLEPDVELTTGMLLANVALSQGLFLGVLVAAAWWTEIPAWALGIGGEITGLEATAWGIGLGLALYLASEVGGAVSERFGIDRDESLRELLAPEGVQGWVALLLVVLPIIAVFEELLFRAALIGAVHAGFGIDPWLLAVVSSAAFALGHSAQGNAGVVVTGLLGFVLAAAFVLTESLLLVIVAHYVVNALEFVVHEGLGIEWIG
ncbi:CPBP family intramembrane glutamic endopeptidase [Natronorarus salvus]|uniref:CPBP family intramembrane glutamic endopeptidase n=1 Tax=Natronorarus salvus TaxID=3117733 RepID=UPI002F268475